MFARVRRQRPGFAEPLHRPRRRQQIFEFGGRVTIRIEAALRTSFEFVTRILFAAANASLKSSLTFAWFPWIAEQAWHWMQEKLSPEHEPVTVTVLTVVWQRRQGMPACGPASIWKHARCAGKIAPWKREGK